MKVLHQNNAQRFNEIHKLFEVYNNSPAKLSMAGTIRAQKKFARIQSDFEMLSSFRKVFMFDPKYWDENLQHLDRLVSRIDNQLSSRQFTLAQLFQYNWSQFRPIRRSLKTLYQFRNSTIAIQFWNQIIDLRQTKWSMKSLEDMNTFGCFLFSRVIFVF